MEVARCSADSSKRSRKNPGESGNMMFAMGLVLLIGSGAAYFMSVSDKVDKGIRSLGAVQNTAYLRTDVRETIRKSMLGTNTECPKSVVSNLRQKFLNFETSVDDAKFDYNYTLTPTKSNPFENESEANCFFHPSRYLGVTFKSVSINLLRSSLPNFITLNSFVQASINISIESAGNNVMLKYLLRYRVDALGLNHFGIIFDDVPQLFSIAEGASVLVHGMTLVDQGDRTKQIPLSSLLDLPSFDKVIYKEKVWVAGEGLSTDMGSITFLQNKKLADVFSQGIDYAVLPSSDSFKAPYQVNESQWKEMFNYDMMDSMYPLPALDSQTSAISSPSMGVIYNYTLNKEGGSYSAEASGKNTADIYTGLYGSKGDLFKSCTQADVGVGQYNLLIFDNVSKDFVIDFSESVDSARPPVFCGLIAAKNIKIILNDKDVGEFRKHYLIGKFIVKGTVIVQKKGELQIHDIMKISDGEVPHPGVDINNVRLQFYNQKYFSAQNFQLPFFTDASIYSSGLTTEAGYYIPRATRNFFTKPCGSYMCRMDEIAVPDMKRIVQLYQDSLLFEVFNVE